MGATDVESFCAEGVCVLRVLPALKISGSTEAAIEYRTPTEFRIPGGDCGRDGACGESSSAALIGLGAPRARVLLTDRRRESNGIGIPPEGPSRDRISCLD